MTPYIGRKIEQYFDQSDYTYDDLCVATNITYADLLKIFKGEREVFPDEVKAFAIVFNVTEEQLSAP